MLAPEDRTLISASIRPDPGFQLDHAFITTFTMELAAMLAVPVALSFQEWEEESQGDERGLATQRSGGRGGNGRGSIHATLRA